MNRIPLGWQRLVLCAHGFVSLEAEASPIVISGWLTNVSGNDSPYEYAQFVATQDIDFSLTPYTVVWNDVGLVGSTGTASFSDGWSGGSLLSYAFELKSGTILRGQTFLVGGSAQVNAGWGSTSLAGQRWQRVINTSTTNGDTLGSPDPDSVFGNGGPNADGIAVFAGLAAAITSVTVPLDSVFFGVSVGTALPATGGFKAANNDHYTSTGVFGSTGNDFLYPDLAQNQFARMSGTFNWFTQHWDVPRSGTVVTLISSSPVAAIDSNVALVPEPSTVSLLLGGLGVIAFLRRSTLRRA